MQRMALCSTLPLQASFTKFLNATFLGPRHFIIAGSVNYTYFQFGPLSPAAAGLVTLNHQLYNELQ